MQRRFGRMEQLHLDLKWDYLKWLNTGGEDFDFFESATQKLLKTTIAPVYLERNPFWEDLHTSRN